MVMLGGQEKARLIFGFAWSLLVQIQNPLAAIHTVPLTNIHSFFFLGTWDTVVDSYSES